ncbi:MAG TPA: CDP-diacylglycerol diphosphatase [Caulobacteraceae bacterium]|nr:CDP-diacylglycerol diphosphatase [Caulobacteraceae bacterium]
MRLAIVALAGLTWIAASRARAADPNALWHVVHDLCVPDMKVSGAPAPCSKVDLAGGYAVLKDIRGDTQLLLIPTDRVTGIESPQLLAPGSPNYWEAAWDALPLFEKRTGGRPVRREDVALAINSQYGRTQNQLHIHLDCVRPDVQRILADNQSRIGEHWSDLDAPLSGHHYRVRRLMGADFGTRDPFKLLAEGDAAARADMGLETMVAIGETFPGGRPGFILLARAGQLPFDKAAGEELQDHSCAMLGPHP